MQIFTRDTLDIIITKILSVIFTSTRRVIFISLVLTGTMIMYFGFWTYMGITIVVCAIFIILIWCDGKLHPVD
jgi:hypothetical protein